MCVTDDKSIAQNVKKNTSFPETTGAHLGSQGDQDCEVSAKDSKPNDDLIQSLFYLHNDQTNREVYTSSHGKVLHKAMQYCCVDGSGPNKRIEIDLVDFIQSKANTASGQPKNRSLIYFKVLTDGDEGDTVVRQDNKIKELAQEKKHDSFDQMYNRVTQQLVSRVIENEQARQDKAGLEKEVTNSLPQAFLLIGENDSNLVAPPVMGSVLATSKPEINDKSKSGLVAIHERLYKESREKKGRMQQMESRL